MTKRSTEFRIPFRCQCGAGIICKTRIVGQIKNCPACRLVFTVPHPGEQFWVVLPNRPEQAYFEHFEAVWNYAKVLDEIPDVFLHNAKQIIRTLSDIQTFLNDVAHGQSFDSGREAVLRRLCEGEDEEDWKHDPTNEPVMRTNSIGQAIAHVKSVRKSLIEGTGASSSQNKDFA